MSDSSVCLKSWYYLGKCIVFLSNYFQCDIVILEDDKGRTFLHQTSVKYFHDKKRQKSMQIVLH